ncbi:carbonic anhydrase [Trichlorobacter ammonificans]|uniref:Carbonic anhydrase n=1 Tax=Trichlorobacter ammonificans TaxID=2916410 RepID=A0ABM9D6P7_9BACT|nr:carbonic anhydrase [Trichlorobacter ammonificans]CAH2030907.1 Carbonic anhydrase [Trichlorobacter ammonificans]
MKDIQRFIAGFRTFQESYFGAGADHFEPLKEGQSPKTMIIGCSDSRVDPALLTNCAPGDIFTVRNVANLVPPFEEKGGRHGVSAALEFAVCHLGVEHIVVLGHSGCGGIKALMAGTCGCKGGGFISHWMSIAAPARERVLTELPDKEPGLQQRAAEQAAILLSLENLRSFPWIDQRVASGTLSLHGWYFDITAGELLEYQQEGGCFEPVKSC